MINTNNPEFTLREKLKAVPKDSFQWIWVILFLGMSTLTFLQAFPAWTNYFDKELEIERIDQQNLELEDKITELETQLLELESQRDEKGKAFIKKEAQWLPESVNVAQTAALLEMVALQLENLDMEREAHFNLVTANFKDKDNSSIRHQASLSFTSDEENLKLFIDYLENGRIPSIIRKGVEQKFIGPNILSTLENNNTPLASITELQVTQDTRTKNLLVNMQLNFYTRPL